MLNSSLHFVCLKYVKGQPDAQSFGHCSLNMWMKLVFSYHVMLHLLLKKDMVLCLAIVWHRLIVIENVFVQNSWILFRGWR